MGIQISLPMMAFLVFMTGFAGFVDSAAGGGGLISLPAYLFAGLPPHYTYATNKFMERHNAVGAVRGQCLGRTHRPDAQR